MGTSATIYNKVHLLKSFIEAIVSTRKKFQANPPLKETTLAKDKRDLTSGPPTLILSEGTKTASCNIIRFCKYFFKFPQGKTNG